MTQFTTHRLTFTAEVETPIEMNAFKGSALRGAWQSHLRTLYCAQTNPTDALHQAMCPVCYLLSRDTGSGADRRPYALMPPLVWQQFFTPGERFQFGMSIFGEAVQFIPYLILAVSQMGQTQGLGRPRRITNGRTTNERGKFRIVAIDEETPFNQIRHPLLREGDTMIQSPAHPIDEAAIASYCEQTLAAIADGGNRLTLAFLTPTRLIREGKLVRTPHFRPFLARLVDRIDALRQQYASAPRLPKAERDELLNWADHVSLVQNQTCWWDVKGHSTRLNQQQNLGGFFGSATYQAPSADIWAALLPWLVWGTITQVGKHTVKGCGWYRLETREARCQS